MGGLALGHREGIVLQQSGQSGGFGLQDVGSNQRP